MLTLGIEEAFIDYWMGHKTSVYSDMEMKGIDFHRELYFKSGLRIRPRDTSGKIDLLKQMVTSLGASPDEIRQALQSLTGKPHRIHATPQEQDDTKVGVLTEPLVDKVRDRLNNSGSKKLGESTRLNWWARPDSPSHVGSLFGPKIWTSFNQKSSGNLRTSLPAMLTLGSAAILPSLIVSGRLDLMLGGTVNMASSLVLWIGSLLYRPKPSAA